VTRALILVLAALALVAAGCGGDDDTSSTSGTSGASGAAGAEDAGTVNEIDVSLDEYSVTPSPIEPASLAPGETVTTKAKAGDVTFHITNNGEETHSLVFNNAGKEIAIDGELAPGESTDLTVPGLTSGFYEYYCPIDDHQGKGMQAQLEVVG